MTLLGCDERSLTTAMATRSSHLLPRP